jgi:hypothetical protein
VPFLGRYAWTSRLPAYLSTVTGCAAVPVVCVPLDDGRYRMTFAAPILPQGEGDDEIERLTRRYVAAHEPYIRERPELWLWLHSRWRRTRPQRRPEAIARLVAEARLPPAAPLREVARRAPEASPLRRLDELVGDAFLEESRHLVLVVPSDMPAAAAVGEAFARLGHATRYFTLEELCRSLERARDEGRLNAALRDLDPFPLLIVADCDPSQLDRPRLDLVAQFLRHRRERGSVVVAGAGVAAWQDVARRLPPTADSLQSFIEACAVVDLSEVDPATFAGSGAANARAEPRGEAEAEARAI